MGQIFSLSLRQLSGVRRVIIILIAALIPVGLALIIPSGGSADDFVNALIDGLIVGAVMPIIVMSLATASFGNEIEDKTLSYIALKPVPRWQIALPKFLAPVAIAAPLVVASGAAAAYIGLGDVRAAVSVAAALLVGLAAYAAIFTWAGLVTTRALSFAIVYVFLWEGLLSTFIGGVRYLSVRGYTLAIMPGLDPDGLGALEERVIEFPAAVVGAALVCAVFLGLTVWRLRKMDVP